MGREKVACWSTKAAISLKRIKREEKLLWRACIGSQQRSFQLYHSVPFPTPYVILFPKIGVRNPHPKLQSLLSQERVKLRTANLARTIIGSIRQKPIKNFGEKGAWAYPARDCPSFWGRPTHIISGTARTG